MKPSRNTNRLPFLLCLLLAVVLASIGLINVVSAQTPASERRLILEDYQFQGNSKTKPEVLRRYLQIEPGQEITPEIIDLARQRLEQTNFFKQVLTFTRPGSQKGKVILIVEVKERYWPYFSFEGGHGDLDGWFFVPASLRFDNASGNGSRLGLKWELGDHRTILSLGYSNQFFNVVHFDGQIFGGDNEFIHYLDGRQINHRMKYGGGVLRISGIKGITKHLFLSYSGERYDTKTIKRPDGTVIPATDLPPSIVDDLDETTLRTLAVGLHVDTRDNAIYPLAGFWGALSLGAINDADGRIPKYNKLTVDARAYQKVTDTQVLALHLKAGFVDDQAPFYDRFYLGGPNSLRGYSDRRLTPEGWGTKLFLARTEFRFPITKSGFPYHKSSGVIFFDTGGIWQTGETPSVKDFISTVGVGFRVRLPVLGITRFDFGFPLDKIDGNDFKFQLSLGHTF